MYAHATCQRTIASTMNSTMLCRKKCTSMLPTAASGRISRGNDTFFTSPEFATTEPVAAPSPVENRFHTSRPESSQIGKAGMPDPQDDRERDVEDHEVEQRVEQRPREPEDAVLVLDLQLVADHPDEQLAALDDPREALPSRHAGPDDRRFAGGARHSNLRRGHGIHVTPLGQPQPGSDRAVIRRRRGQHLAAERLDAAPHEHVIDLTVRAPRRDTCGPAPGAPSPRITAPTGGPQKLKSPARICGPPAASPRAQRQQVAAAARAATPSTTCAARSPRPASRRSRR